MSISIRFHFNIIYSKGCWTFCMYWCYIQKLHYLTAYWCQCLTAFDWNRNPFMTEELSLRDRVVTSWVLPRRHWFMETRRTRVWRTLPNAKPNSRSKEIIMMYWSYLCQASWIIILWNICENYERQGIIEPVHQCGRIAFYNRISADYWLYYKCVEHRIPFAGVKRYTCIYCSLIEL